MGMQNKLNMKTYRIIPFTAAILFGSLLFVGCSTTPTEQKAETNKELNKIEDKMEDATVPNTQLAWEADRADVLEDLRDLRDNIESKLAVTNVKLAEKDLKPSDRKDQEAMKAELTKEKNIVEGLITKAENATDPTWESTKLEIRASSDDVKGWWARFKDNIDKKTDADKDHDGH
jgi:hypothetical protein